jgi:hypothetical protein
MKRFIEVIIEARQRCYQSTWMTTLPKTNPVRAVDEFVDVRQGSERGHL